MDLCLDDKWGQYSDAGMLHRQTEVKFRDNQENRVQQFPKTPKNVNTLASSKFVTPAPKTRVALGAKSTNVHNRQFSTIKTGKRHSPVQASKQISVVAPEEAQKLTGGAARRAALQQAILTGIDVPDVEYAPPPVQELPYDEPEWLTPMDYDALRESVKRGHHFAPSLWTMPTSTVELEDEAPPVFEFLDMPTMPAEPRPTSRRPETGSATRKLVNSARLGNYAAPTAAAQAKVKVPVKSLSSAVQPSRSKSIRRSAATPDQAASMKPRPPLNAVKTTPPTLSSRSASAASAQELSATESILGPIEIPDFALPEMEVKFDFE